MPCPAAKNLHPLTFEQLVAGLVSHRTRMLEEIWRLTDESHNLCARYAAHISPAHSLEAARYLRNSGVIATTPKEYKNCSTPSSCCFVTDARISSSTDRGSNLVEAASIHNIGMDTLLVHPTGESSRRRVLAFEEQDRQSLIKDYSRNSSVDGHAKLLPLIKVIESVPHRVSSDRGNTTPLQAARGDDCLLSEHSGLSPRPVGSQNLAPPKVTKGHSGSSLRLTFSPEDCRNVKDDQPAEENSMSSPAASSNLGKQAFALGGSRGVNTSWVETPSAPKVLAHSSSMISLGIGVKDETHGVYPYWFNPKGRVPFLARGWTPTFSFKSSNKSQEPTFCYLSPKGPTRFSWDLFWCLMMSYELWIIPIDLFFLADAGELPSSIKALNWIVTIFFTVDIVLNFMTGYIDCEIEVTQNWKIVIHYLKTWFVIDVLATMPWSEILTMDNSSASSASSSLRVGKATKAVKIVKISRLLRGIKMLRHFKLMKSLLENWSYENIIKNNPKRLSYRDMLLRILFNVVQFLFQYGGVPFQLLIILVLFSHALGVCHGLASSAEKGMSHDFDAALDDYYSSLWWSFSMLTFGTSLSQPSSSSLSAFFLFALWGRSILVFKLIAMILFYALRLHAEDAGEFLRRRDALEYMDSHNVSDDIRIQALANAKANRDLYKIQANFNYFLNNTLPQELARTIREELWSDHLVSLGLIFELSGWCKDFLPDLAQHVQEEVYAAGVIVFREGDAAIVAYNVVNGSIMIMDSTRPSLAIPPFTEGMWFGEKALVNPELRRSGSAMTDKKSDLMTVSSADFFALIEKHDMKVDYQHFCMSELWKGMCGRCGSLGEHWSDECHVDRERPGQKPFSPGQKTISNGRNSSASGWGSMDILVESLTPDQFLRDLKLFVAKYHLENLVPMLCRAEISCLDDCLDIHKRQALFLDADAGQYCKELDCLSMETVNSFKRHIMGVAKGVLQVRVAAGSHFIFLSHYKVEAGTEAALMRSELEQMIGESDEHAAQRMKVPVFLDSEDLTSLFELMEAVRKSHNVVLLLTKGVLSRPWCLVEIVTAVKENISIIPVNIMKVGCEFEFPDAKFYEELMDGTILGDSGVELLNEHDISIEDVVEAVQMTLKRIAIPYSPHRPLAIRRTELQALLKLSKMRDTNAVGHHHGSRHGSRQSRRFSGRSHAMSSSPGSTDTGARRRSLT